MNPTRERKIAAKQAIDDYFAYDNFGTPGPIDDQPAEWVESVTATSHAAKKVKAIIEEEMKQEQEKKQKEQQKKAKSGSSGRRRRR